MPIPKTSRYVYVMATAIGLTKVGIADDPSHRLGQMRGHSPVEVMLFQAIKLPRKLAMEVEALCHKELDEFRKRGEWFKIDPEIAWTCVQKHADAVMRATDIDHTERRRREEWLIRELDGLEIESNSSKKSNS